MIPLQLKRVVFAVCTAAAMMTPVHAAPYADLHGHDVLGPAARVQALLGPTIQQFQMR